MEMNSYELSRKWFDWSFENPDKVRPIHSALYFFAIEHCNRMGWKQKFGFPTMMVMESIGVKNSRTYAKALSDLIDFGFIKMYQSSKNQYSASVIGIVFFTKATTKALDKARSKHIQKQGQSTALIDKPLNNITIEQGNVNARATDILKFSKQSEFESCQMQNKKNIKNWQDLESAFNDKMDLEIAQSKIEFDPDQLMPRFRSFVRNYIQNENKPSYQKPEQQNSSKPPKRY